LSEKTSLAQRTVVSIGWNFAGNAMQIGIGLGRSILLARLLAVETFGAYAWAHSVVALSAALPNFGLGSAFMHRAPETEDEDQAASVHFTLQLMLTLAWAIVLILSAVIFVKDDARRMALIWMTFITVGKRFASTPRLILMRRVIHRRLTLIQIMDTALSSVIALVLAWQGVSLWALLATDVVTFLVLIIGLYVWCPVWHPRLAWQPHVMRHFISFGSRNFIAGTLQYALDRVDDLWVGSYLGNTAMGLYSRAYTFALYPRRFLAAPIQSVSSGAYAELKEDRKRLSQVFYRTNALLIRTSFLFGGILALIAPEFIRLLLGERWLPMLNTFRLMLVYTLLDPFKLTIADVFIAVGKPEKIAFTRAVQLFAMGVGLFVLGSWVGIAGVAVAVDMMLLVGIVILLWQARAYVDYSLKKLFLIPLLSLIVSLGLALLAVEIPLFQGSDWHTGFGKVVVFLVTYCGILALLEFRNFLMLIDFLSSLLHRARVET